MLLSLSRVFLSRRGRGTANFITYACRFDVIHRSTPSPSSVEEVIIDNNNVHLTSSAGVMVGLHVSRN